VIEIDDNDDYPVLPMTNPILQPKVEIVSPTPPTRYPSHDHRPPPHLGDYHLFTMVADECRLPSTLPYYTVGGTTVDLAIADKEHMAHVCHYVMTHTADSLYHQDSLPTKKQYSVKAGLRRFADCGNDAVVKELTQFHTLKCFSLVTH
jgi:hypothetical protein